MFKFTRAGVNLISLSITIFIFCLIQIFIYQYANGIEMDVDIKQEIMMQQEEMQKETKEVTVPEIQTTNNSEKIWKLEIGKISLIADISEGTDKEILNKYIGHFTTTQKENGNIGLAAHNRGYEVNYFEKLKQLEKGDEIKYKYNQYEKTYEVTKNIIIKDTDWTYLEDTEENQLTLITCVENEPEYRRCVQAIEKEKEENY